MLNSAFLIPHAIGGLLWVVDALSCALSFRRWP
jgi:hypothetical protein